MDLSKKYVFISYSNRDKEYASELYKFLVINNINVCMPGITEFDHEKPWLEVYSSLIKGASCYCFIASEDGINSKALLKEVSLMDELNIPCFALRNSDVESNGPFEEFLKPYDFYVIKDFFNNSRVVNSFLYQMLSYALDEEMIANKELKKMLISQSDFTFLQHYLALKEPGEVFKISSLMKEEDVSFTKANKLCKYMSSMLLIYMSYDETYYVFTENISRFLKMDYDEAKTFYLKNILKLNINNIFIR